MAVLLYYFFSKLGLIYYHIVLMTPSGAYMKKYAILVSLDSFDYHTTPIWGIYEEKCNFGELGLIDYHTELRPIWGIYEKKNV